MEKEADQQFAPVAAGPRASDAQPLLLRILPRPLRTLYEWSVLYACLGQIAASGLLLSFVGMILTPLLPRATATRFGQRAISGIFRVTTWIMRASGIVRLDLTALDDLRDAGPLVLAPNHPSMLDAVFVISRLPSVACVMKHEIHHNVFLGGGARLAGYIGNATTTGMLRGVARALGDGQQVLLFPEGTRTVTQPINALKGSFAIAAKQAGVPVQTIIIQTNSPFLSKGWSIFRKPEFPLEYRVRLGRRFQVSDLRTAVADTDAHLRRELGPDNRLRGR